MKHRNILLLSILLTVLSCSEGKRTEFVSNPADLVSTLAGSLSEHSFSTGNTYPATALPWGMNFWTPVTGKMGDGWAYRYDAHQIRGFKQTHQPSPWINDYGQFSIMPVKDASLVDQDARASWFSHKSETAKPYYYRVYLADHDVRVELSPSDRAVAMRFTYGQGENSGIIIDAFDGGSFIQFLPEENALVGYTTKNSGGVPENFRNWFIVEFDKPISACTLYDGPQKPREGVGSLEADHVLASLSFSTEKGEQVNLRAASSFISREQALLNLEELAGKDFQQVKEEARARWNEVLGRIAIAGGSEMQQRTFYTCLYRSVLFPRKFYELGPDGLPYHYSPYNGEVREGYLYTDTGFWDSFRALFPLLNLVYPSVNREIQEGLANIARENDFLPEWASPGHRGCMVGNNSASVVADAIVKGTTPKEEWQTLYDRLVYGTEHHHPEVTSSGRLGHEYYNSLGYIPYNVGINENVARTLEYAYNDWCLLQIAEKLGRPQEELDKWEARSRNWKNVFDPENRLMRGRNLDGSFQEPFSPYKWGDAFTEGNAWHYSWSVFHDVEGLKEAMGGSEAFEDMLDSVFVVPPVYDDSYYGYRIHEITEMQVADMGNYAHGNQPAQHIIYLYDWTDSPWKAQKHIREVMDRLYSADPDGYCGDEDNGQTSAWYVFSALGFYPVCPGSDEYALGAPYFPEARIKLENGRMIEISAGNARKEDAREWFGCYVSAKSLNGRAYDSNFIRHSELCKGARLEFTMSDQAIY